MIHWMKSSNSTNLAVLIALLILCIQLWLLLSQISVLGIRTHLQGCSVSFSADVWTASKKKDQLNNLFFFFCQEEYLIKNSILLSIIDLFPYHALNHFCFLTLKDGEFLVKRTIWDSGTIDCTLLIVWIPYILSNGRSVQKPQLGLWRLTAARWAWLNRHGHLSAARWLWVSWRGLVDAKN